MVETKENSSFTYKFLNQSYFKELHQTFLAAFSDYVVPLQHTEDQFRQHITDAGTDLELSVGCFAGPKMVGFSLNAPDMWKERMTAYDAATGVIPEFRRRGVGRAMFEFMIPQLRERGVEQLLLEVITTNEKARELYRSLGFIETRKLLVVAAAARITLDGEIPRDVSIREITEPDWELFATFADGEPAWQNSPQTIGRLPKSRKKLGIFFGELCVGYIVLTPGTGVIIQLAVDKNFRQRGFGSILLAEAQKLAGEDTLLRVRNIDASLSDTVRFLHNWGFAEGVSQFEMTKDLNEKKPGPR